MADDGHLPRVEFVALDGELEQGPQDGRLPVDGARGPAEASALGDVLLDGLGRHVDRAERPKMFPDGHGVGPDRVR